MDLQNVKVYIAVSLALIVLLVLIIIIPFSSKKPSSSLTPNSLTPSPSSIFPTSVKTGSITLVPNNLTPSPSPISPGFTGALDETIPPKLIDSTNQKNDLLSKVPLSLTTFTVDFDYSDDKFIVTLKEPRDQAQREFESWKAANYSGLNSEQFILK
jgi:hypothetical protein